MAWAKALVTKETAARDLGMSDAMHHSTPRLWTWLGWLWLACSVPAQAQSAPATPRSRTEEPRASTKTPLQSVQTANALSATVVALDGDQLVIDLGRAQLREGAVLTLYRTIEVKHPTSGAQLRDRFPNGTVRVLQVGEALSIVKPETTPPRPPLVGDRVEAEGKKVAPRSCEQCEVMEAAQRTILEVFGKTLGKTPEERIAIFKAHLQRDPSTPFRAWLEYEMKYFASGRFVASMTRQAQGSFDTAVQGLVKVGILSHAQAGLPVEFGVYVPPEMQVRGITVLLSHSDGTQGYTPRAVSLDERGQGRLRIPAEFVRAPGFSYFVEANLADNRTIPVLASASQPERCTVAPVALAPTEHDLSRVRAVSEYVSFDRLSGRDYYYLFEGDFLLRLTTRVLEGVRLGYGHYRGEGGTVKDLDERHLAPHPAAFTYGYIEAVFALHELVALLPRLEVGLGRPRDETSTGSRVRPGGQLRVRIGRERGTALILGGESTPEIGQRAFVGLNLGLIEKIPLAFEVHVTDQPVNTNELGVRAVFEAGYRPNKVFALAARASYQGRTIDHAGPGLGIAATFGW